LLLAKILVFGIDHIPRIFLGDSAFYLYTSYTGAIPDDRSFTYGCLIAFLTGGSHIQGLLLAQTLSATITALLAAVILRCGFGASRALAAAAAILAALAPLQLAYERFVLTESFATLCFALMVTAAALYLRRPNALLLVGTSAAGVGLLSLRLNTVPLAWATIVLAPLLAWTRVLRPWRHLAIGLLATLTLHSAYREHYAALRQGPPSYYYGRGGVLLALLSPLIQPEDFPTSEFAARVLAQTEVPLQGPALHLRDLQMWAPTGLMTALRRNLPDEDSIEVNSIAEAIALHAVRRDPLGTVMLGVTTVRSYLDPFLTGDFYPLGFRRIVKEEQGPDQVPDGDPLRRFSISSESIQPSFTRWWHSEAIPWYPMLLLCPAVGLAAAALIERRRRAMTLFIAAQAMFAIMTGPFIALSTVVRYLHSLEWLMVLSIAILFHAIASRTTGATAECRSSPESPRNADLEEL